MKQIFFWILFWIAIGFTIACFIYFIWFQKTEKIEEMTNSDSVNVIETKDVQSVSDKVYEEYVLPKQNWEKKVSWETLQAFQNIEAYHNKDEIYAYRLGLTLLLQLGSWDCDGFSKTFWFQFDELFIRECKTYQWYIYYLNGDKSFLGDNNLSKEFEKGECKNEFLCAALFWKSRDDFTKASLEYLKWNEEEQKQLLSNIEPSSYSFLSFHKDTTELSVSETIDVLYDNSLIFTAFSKKDTETCENIKNDILKKYCLDSLTWKNKLYYENLFYDFFSELYIRNAS